MTEQTEQPKALRIAETLRSYYRHPAQYEIHAAEEICKLHELTKELVICIKSLLEFPSGQYCDGYDEACINAEKLIEKAEYLTK